MEFASCLLADRVARDSASMSRTTADGAELRDLAYLAIRQIDRGNPAIENIGMSFHRFYDLNSTMSQKQAVLRSEEHTSELQSLMRNSYAVFFLKKKNTKQRQST